MRLKVFLFAIITILTLTNCANYNFSRRVVQQGNLLPQDKIDRLKLGMSKDDAAILMGTSLLSPTFANDRWDYAYTWRKGNGSTQAHHVTLYFSQGRLAHIDK